MPDAGKNAISTWNGDGGVTDFLIGFTYVKKDYVVVELDGVDQGRPPTKWDLLGTSQVRFVTAPPAGTGNVVIKRVSGGSVPVTVQSGAAVPASDFNTATAWLRDYIQEVEDKT